MIDTFMETVSFPISIIANMILHLHINKIDMGIACDSRGIMIFDKNIENIISSVEYRKSLDTFSYYNNIEEKSKIFLNTKEGRQNLIDAFSDVIEEYFEEADQETILKEEWARERIIDLYNFCESKVIRDCNDKLQLFLTQNGKSVSLSIWGRLGEECEDYISMKYNTQNFSFELEEKTQTGDKEPARKTYGASFTTSSDAFNVFTNRVKSLEV